MYHDRVPRVGSRLNINNDDRDKNLTAREKTVNCVYRVTRENIQTLTLTNFNY